MSNLKEKNLCRAWIDIAGLTGADANMTISQFQSFVGNVAEGLYKNSYSEILEDIAIADFYNHATLILTGSTDDIAAPNELLNELKGKFIDNNLMDKSDVFESNLNDMRSMVNEKFIEMFDTNEMDAMRTYKDFETKNSHLITPDAFLEKIYHKEHNIWVIRLTVKGNQGDVHNIISSVNNKLAHRG